MPDVYVILGESDTRKSSTVRALTGAPMQYDAWRVATNPPTGKIDIDVYVQIQALQEAGIAAPDFVDKIADVDKHRVKHGLSIVTNILVPLRILGVNGFHDGADYLKHFAGIPHGWNIRPIVVLGVAALPTTLCAWKQQSICIPFQNTIPPTMPPANGIASQIRPLWNWL